MPPARRNNQGPSQAIGGEGEDDRRFAELFKPIKDLTENWEFPLARILEEYYDKLHDVQISIDGQTQKVRLRKL